MPLKVDKSTENNTQFMVDLLKETIKNKIFRAVCDLSEQPAAQGEGKALGTRVIKQIISYKMKGLRLRVLSTIDPEKLAGSVNIKQVPSSPLIDKVIERFNQGFKSSSKADAWIWETLNKAFPSKTQCNEFLRNVICSLQTPN